MNAEVYGAVHIKDMVNKKYYPLVYVQQTREIRINKKKKEELKQCIICTLLKKNKSLLFRVLFRYDPSKALPWK